MSRRSCAALCASAPSTTTTLWSSATSASAMATETRRRSWLNCGARSCCTTRTCAAVFVTSHLCLRTPTRKRRSSFWTILPRRRAGAPVVVGRQSHPRARRPVRYRRRASVGVRRILRSFRMCLMQTRLRGIWDNRMPGMSFVICLRTRFFFFVFLFLFLFGTAFGLMLIFGYASGIISVFEPTLSSLGFLTAVFCTAWISA